MAAEAVLVVVLSVVPTDDVVPEIPFLDKAGHLCQYLLFAWLLVQAMRSGGAAERIFLLWAWIYAVSYGLLMELLQAFVPWRSADPVDAATNAIGAALGVWLGRRFPPQGRRQSVVDSP